MAVDVSSRDFNVALWERFKGGKIRNVYPLAKYNDIVEKIKTMERNPPCNIPGEYYLLRKFVVANVDGKERLCSKPENCSLSEKTIDSVNRDLKFYVALEEIYCCIDDVHRSLKHGGKDRIVRSLQKKGVVNITRETVELYLTFCHCCRPQCKTTRKTKPVIIRRVIDSPVNNVSSESEDKFSYGDNFITGGRVSPTNSRNSETYFSLSRSYIDLIDFSSSPDGDYRFVLLYLDLQTNFCILNPVRCKCPFEIVSHLLNIFTLFGPTQVLHSSFDESFIVSVISQMKQSWPELVIVCGTLNYQEIQEVAVTCIAEIHCMLKTWLSENNSHRWSYALKFIQLRKNTAVGSRSTKSPYEFLFSKTLNIFKSFPEIELSSLREVNKEDDLINLINSQPEHCENLQIALDPNICNFVQNNESNDAVFQEVSDQIIETSIIKPEPLSDSENGMNHIQDFSDSSNDTCSSSGFGKLKIVIKQEKEDQ